MSLIIGEEKQPKQPHKSEGSGRTKRGRLPAPGRDVQTVAAEAEDADFKAQQGWYEQLTAKRTELIL